MKKYIRVFLLVFCAVLSAGFFFEPKVPFKKATSSALIMPAPNNVSTNWKNAGLTLIGGIPTRSTVCATVNTSGLTPPQSGDDASNIQTAINGCPAGQVVQLGSGVFMFDTSESVQINTGITLRGTGTCNGVSLGANPQSTGGPYCATVLIMYNGPWVSSSSTGYDGISNRPPCGSTSGTLPSGTPPGSLSSCPFTGALIQIQPNFSGNNGGLSGCQLFSGNPTTQPCGATLAADVAQGATTVQINDQTNFSVGQWVVIDEDAALTTCASPIGHGSANFNCSPEGLNTSPSPAVARYLNTDVNCNYSLCGTTLRGNIEVHLISAMGAGPCPGVNCTLTFDSPLVLGFRQSGSHDARVYWPTIAGSQTPIPFVTQASVENLSINRTAGLPLQMVMCAYCWLKNVDLSYWDGGASMIYSARVEWTHSVFRDCVDCTNSGAEYPFAIDTGSTETLVYDNITLFGGKGMVGRGATASVIAYNYTDWQRYSHNAIIDAFQDMSVNATHEGGTHSFLLEGNAGPNCDGDNTHGNSFYHVYFRNWCFGTRTKFLDATACNGLVDDATGASWSACGVPHTGDQFRRGAGPMALTYWYAYLGNVMGKSGVSTVGNGWAYFTCQNGACGQNSQQDQSIWISGWTGLEFDFNNWGDPNLDGTNTPTFVFKNSNYDYVTASINDGVPAGYSGSFPNSLYLSSKPAFFSAGSCTYPWPWVTATSSPFVQPNTGGGGCGGSGLPALARWQAGTPMVQP